MQPPSGGCVLKLSITARAADLAEAAAFGRLCVETRRRNHQLQPRRQPPSGGCVLKLSLHRQACRFRFQPPSGGCVLKR